MNGALFLDRDGVINRMAKYQSGWDSPQQPDDVRLVTGIAKIVAWANGQEIPVVEITNQPGVAKGKINQKTADAIEAKIHKLLHAKGATVDRTFICPHHPGALLEEFKKICDCRKPKPGLILKAAKELGIILNKSAFLGDSDSDVKAAKAAGVKSIIYIHNENDPAKLRSARQAKADFEVSSMKEAFQTIRNNFKPA